MYDQYWPGVTKQHLGRRGLTSSFNEIVCKAKTNTARWKQELQQQDEQVDEDEDEEEEEEENKKVLPAVISSWQSQHFGQCYGPSCNSQQAPPSFCFPLIRQIISYR